MGLFSRKTHTTEPGIDPESGEPVVNIRSHKTGGHIVTSRPTQAEADAEAARLARAWKNLEN
jgi:hypothetical protein